MEQFRTVFGMKSQNRYVYEFNLGVGGHDPHNVGIDEFRYSFRIDWFEIRSMREVATASIIEARI